MGEEGKTEYARTWFLLLLLLVRFILSRNVLPRMLWLR